MKGKKLLIVLFSVFVLTVATAVPVMGAGSGATEVGGTVSGVIDVTAPPEVSLGTMLPGTYKTLDAPMTVIVHCNVAGWSLGAADNRAEPISAGHMDNGEDTALANALEIIGGDQSTYTALSATDVMLEDGGGSAGATSISDVYFRQTVEYTDPPDTYSIVVTFTGYTS